MSAKSKKPLRLYDLPYLNWTKYFHTSYYMDIAAGAAAAKATKDVTETGIEKLTKVVRSFFGWFENNTYSTLVKSLLVALFVALGYSRVARKTGVKAGRLIFVVLVGLIFFWAWEILEKEKAFLPIQRSFSAKFDYFFQIVSEDFLAKMLFWLAAILAFLVAFFSFFSSFLGIEKDSKLFVSVSFWSLPFIVMALGGYTALKMKKMSDNPVANIILKGGIKDNAAWQKAKAKRKIDHLYEIRKNRDYASNLAALPLDEYIYEDLVRDVGKRWIMAENRKGENAVMVAAKKRNFNALEAFAKVLDSTDLARLYVIALKNRDWIASSRFKKLARKRRLEEKNNKQPNI